MAGKTDYVKIAVEPKRKERWEDAVSDNPNVGTLSGLIRLAVERDLSDTSDGGAGMGEEASERLGELLDVSRKTESRLQGLEARLSTIESAVQNDPDVTKLANEVFAVLPSEEEMAEYDNPAVDVAPMEVDGMAYSGMVADIATLVDSSELQVQRALDKLQADTARVREAEAYDGEARYLKEV